ncbi:MAG: hypothetical protein ACRD4U_01720 [Candidatus Acidiferrales bacterium]
MRWVCPNCGQGVSLGLDVCPSCQAGVPAEQRHKVILPPPPTSRARPVPSLESPHDGGLRAFIAGTYHIFIGVLLAFLLIFFFWYIMEHRS